METFLETFQDRSSSFILYGNLNDNIWCADMTVRNIEEFLMRLLKSRGFRHIIFYGGAGTRGAYCLDAESARFFWGENQGIPLPCVFDPMRREDSPSEPDASPDGTDKSRDSTDKSRDSTDKSPDEPDASRTKSHSSASPVQSPPPESDGMRIPARKNGRIPLAGRVSRNTPPSNPSPTAYRPGDPTPDLSQTPDQSSFVTPSDPSHAQEPSGTPSDPSHAQAPSGTPSDPSHAQEPSGTPPHTAPVRYAMREMTPEFFLLKIDALMHDPASDMAVIFYNLFTNDFIGGRSGEALRDNILSGWEQHSGGQYGHNLCLFLAPNTMYATAPLIDQLSQMRLLAKFARQDQNGHFIPEPTVCIEIGMPREDEIHHMLRRFQMIGTGRRRRKITFRYTHLDEITAEILFCSRSCDARGNTRALQDMREYMNQISGRLERYIESRPGEERVEITVDAIDEAWERPSRNREPALEQLRRPGWERVYDIVDNALKKCVIPESVTREKNSVRPVRTDWAVQRLETVPEKNEIRPEIPNFVLLGSPGVGKTTIARLIGHILREYGILKVGNTVEVTKDNLTSPYLGGTSKATMDCVNRAEEGVLFIDEAHSLGTRDGGANHAPTGQEVVSTLNSAMTDPDRHFCVIVSGYEKDMDAVFRLDGGFASRFAPENWIVIDDYGPELLERILTRAITEHPRRPCHLDDALVSEKDGRRPLTVCVERIYRERDRRSFGNARAMEQLAGSVCARAENGLVTEKCFYGLCPYSDPHSPQIGPEWFLPDDTNSADRILAELDALCGLEEVKQDVRDLFHLVKLFFAEVFRCGHSVRFSPERPHFCAV